MALYDPSKAVEPINKWGPTREYPRARVAHRCIRFPTTIAPPLLANRRSFHRKRHWYIELAAPFLFSIYTTPSLTPPHHSPRRDACTRPRRLHTIRSQATTSLNARFWSIQRFKIYNFFFFNSKVNEIGPSAGHGSTVALLKFD